MTGLNTSGEPTEEDLGTMQLDYLLKELELMAVAENMGRDRAQQIGQHFLTASTAITGAVLLVIQTGGNLLLGSVAVLLGSMAVLAFGAFSFLRACNYREGLTVIKLRAFLARRVLLKYGIRPAMLVLPMDGEPTTGFSTRAVILLRVISAFCGLMVSVAMIAGVAAFLHIAGRKALNVSAGYFALYGCPALLGFLVVCGVLQFILRRYQLAAERLTSPYTLSPHCEKKVPRDQRNGTGHG